MKVSTKLFNQQQLKQFTSLNEEIQKTQNKISTGKNILLASDDPTGSVQLSRSEEHTSELQSTDVSRMPSSA